MLQSLGRKSPFRHTVLPVALTFIAFPVTISIFLPLLPFIIARVDFGFLFMVEVPKLPVIFLSRDSKLPAQSFKSLPLSPLSLLFFYISLCSNQPLAKLSYSLFTFEIPSCIFIFC